MDRQRNLLLALLVLLGTTPAVLGEEIGYVETFALAKDRERALQQLIPGTEDYYYYHCLHYQNQQQFERVDELVKQWVQQHQYTERVRVILNRQALLTYDRNPEQSLAYLRQQLNLRFDHQREAANETPQLPTALDPQTIARDALLEQAFQQFQNLDGVEDSALEWLVEQDLSADRRRDLLRRLARPDHETLVELVVADLQAGATFGDYSLHAQLLLEQLDALHKRLPELLSNGNFVNAYLTKLKPGPDEQWATNPQQREAYLERLGAFAGQLPAAFNSLKAHILYHRLVHNRARGVYDRERFLEYLQLPRNAPYVRPEYFQQRTRTEPAVDLSAAFQPIIPLPPIDNDEPLIRSYLEHYFVEATDYRAFAPYLKQEYLRAVFAETKLVHGLGDAQQWYSWLTPAAVQALKDRVDLDFVATNDVTFAPGEPVQLELFIKNVDNLIVKVFEIQTGNYYREQRKEINTDIHLDGLTPNWEQTFHYDEPAVRRVKRRFEFPELARRGVYVIDFIGNGKSSRALVRKGKLRYVAETTAAGHLVTVLDENNEHLTDASVEIDGRRFTSNQEGWIFVPFSPQPGERLMLLEHNGFYTLERLHLGSESYRLEAGIYVDRESVLRGRTAKVAVRPGLYVNEVRIAPDLLKNVRLQVTATDLDGVPSTYTITDLELRSDRETTFEIQIPPRLAQLTFALTAEITPISRSGEPVRLSASDTFLVNGVDTTTHIEDVHLMHVRDGYILELLGRTGEPRPDRPIALQLKHRDFRQPVHVMLKTDAAGLIRLGPLDGIATITATTAGDLSRSWNLPVDQQSLDSALHAAAGQTIEIPHPALGEGEPQRDLFSLLELRDGTYVADWFEALSVEPGVLKVEGLPPGDYDLLFKLTNQRIVIRVADGPRWDNYVLGSARLLESRDPNPPRLVSADVDDEQLRIRIAESDEATRVHLLVTRYQPEFDVFAKLSRVSMPSPKWWRYGEPATAYVEGRDIGDEYRYILERKYATRFPGNMLERPSLLLNPWPVRTTEMSQQAARAGELFAPAAPPAPTEEAAPESELVERLQPVGLANLDFLARTSVVRLNLVPDENGEITLPLAELEDRQQIHIVLAHPLAISYREMALEPRDVRKLDLRLANALDVNQHFTQKLQVKQLGEGESFTLQDASSSRTEIYDELSDLFNLFQTLAPGSEIGNFHFLPQWARADTKQKTAWYSEHACHELNFFLLHKDPAFFDEVVRPYLANKREKQFFDLWLLGENLEHYQEPARYELLNTVERILLAQRLDDLPVVANDIAHRLEVIPRDPARETMLLRTALAGFALEQAQMRPQDRVNLPPLEFSQRLSSGRGGVAGTPGMGRVADADRDAAKANEMRLGEDEALGARRMDFFQRGREKRQLTESFFQPLDKTREWAENQYYHVPLEQMTASLIPPSRFWLDYARHDDEQPFFSERFPEAARNLHDALLALAVLDLPNEAGKHTTSYDNDQWTITAATPLMIVYEAVQATELEPSETASILISEKFFRANDRYRMVEGERQDKFVEDELLVQEVYGAQVVVTNPTSSTQQLDVLVQIPAGAIPLAKSRSTSSVLIQLEPFHTQTLEYFFYFPFTGEFQHYPAHVAREEKVVAHAEPRTLRVVEELSQVDRDSWDYISQQGTTEELLNYLQSRNLHAVDLGRIAWRLRDASLFEKIIDVLSRRHVYNHTVWSYSIHHNRPEAIDDFLLHVPEFIARVGAYLDSPLLVIDPVERRSYEHLEYRPLINARAHQLGEHREILNDRFYVQYHRLMEILSCRRALDDQDRMAVVYYLLLQDRVAEALEFFESINPEQLASRIQYDYMAAYLDFFSPDVQRAEEIASRYANYPVDRWRQAFAAILQQIQEIRGGSSEATDPRRRDQRQDDLAARAPQLDLRVERQQVVLSYRNVERVTVNFYEMDIELLFSSNPFVEQQSGQFAYIHPNHSVELELDAAQAQIPIELPEALRNRNVLVEVRGGGLTRSQPYYSHSLIVEISESYGQLRVLETSERRPLAGVYIKTYARMRDGSVKFYKDGYSDLRGRFDYATLSTNELEQVERFAILLLSPDHGATVREVQPPAGAGASEVRPLP